MRTANYGLGCKHELRHKTQTRHSGLGIKRGLGYKMKNADLLQVMYRLIKNIKQTAVIKEVTWNNI